MSARKFSIEVKNEAKHAEILISGPIGGSVYDESGMTSDAFIEALKTIPEDKPLTIGINSSGGSVADGLAIFNSIKRRKNTTARIDGYAVSIASVIPLAAERVISPKSSIWMIHEPWMPAAGNAEDMLKAAAVLEKHGETLAMIYEQETGMTAEDVRAKMKAETWFRGDEAVAMGFADESPDQAVAFNSFDATAFKNCPKEILQTILASAVAVTHNSTNAGPATCAAPLLSSPPVAKEDSQNKPAVTTAKKDPNMSEPLATVAADKSAEILAKIEALETKLNAPAPASPKIENLGNPLVEKYEAMSPGAARNQFRVANHSAIMREFGKVKNANTIDSALIPDYMSDAAITVLNNKLAMLSNFALGIGINPLAPRQTVQVSLASAGSTTLTNGTNFEQGDSTLDGQPITVDQYTQPFHLTNAQINQGIVLSRLAGVNANTLANKISDVVTALFVVGNYANTHVIVGADTAFTPTGGKLSLIYKAAKNFRQKNLLMDGGHLAYLIPTDKFAWGFGENGAFGFDKIAEHNRYTGATPNSVGFVSAPEAVLIASGAPLNLPSSEFLSQNTIQLANGLSVVASSWYSRASRNVYMSYDVMFGAGVGDATAGTRIISA